MVSSASKVGRTPPKPPPLSLMKKGGGRVHFVTEFIRRELLDRFDGERILAAEAKIFPEGFRAYGIVGGKAQISRIISGASLAYSRPLDFKTRLTIADELFQSRMYEECQAAILLLHNQGKNFKDNTLNIFTEWIDNYVENWAVCDSFCIGLVSQYYERHPARLTDLSIWAASDNRWRRRAACVTLSKLCRSGQHLDDVLRLAKFLLPDPDAMVQKAVGWLLKEASRTRAEDVISFLNRNREGTPRLVRSHATELMSAAQKARVSR